MNEKIVLDPMPEPGQIQPASLDVRLAGEAFHPASCSKFNDGFTICSGEFLLGSTLERIEMPNDIAAMLTGRSTLGRKGVTVHATAGWIDPGYEGTITTEMTNLSYRPVDIDHGIVGAQLVFFPLSSSSSGYDGQYQDQEGPTGPGSL